MMSSPPAPPITSFDPWSLLTKMEGTMDDGGRSPGTEDPIGITHTLQEYNPPCLHSPRSKQWLSETGGSSKHWHVAAHLPSSPQGAPVDLGLEAWLSPGGGVTLEPREYLQHKSSSSLLRRMPVLGEYTIAPKLQAGRWSLSLGSHQHRAPTPWGQAKGGCQV